MDIRLNEYSFLNNLWHYRVILHNLHNKRCSSPNVTDWVCVLCVTFDIAWFTYHLNDIQSSHCENWIKIRSNLCMTCDITHINILICTRKYNFTEYSFSSLSNIFGNFQSPHGQVWEVGGGVIRVDKVKNVERENGESKSPWFYVPSLLDGAWLHRQGEQEIVIWKWL